MVRYYEKSVFLQNGTKVAVAIISQTVSRDITPGPGIDTRDEDAMLPVAQPVVSVDTDAPLITPISARCSRIRYRHRRNILVLV